MSLVQPYVVAIRPVSFFKPSECVDEARVRELAECIRREGCWLQPMPVEGVTGLVMDGNHRLTVARLLGLKCLPCVPLSYDDPRVGVACWRSGRPFDRRDIFAVLDRQCPLPFKSTRHRFEPPLPATEIRLELLM